MSAISMGRGRSLRGAGAAVAVWVVLGWLPMLNGLTSADPWFALVIMASSLTVAASFLGRARPLLGISLGFFHLFFVYAGLAQISSQIFPLAAGPYDADDISFAWALVALFTVCFLAGYFARATRSAGPLPPKRRTKASKDSPALLYGAILMLILLWLYVVAKGAHSALFASREAFTNSLFGLERTAGAFGNEEFGPVDGLALKAVQVGPIVSGLICLIAYRRTRSKAAISAWCAALALVNPISSPRFIFGAFFLGSVFVATLNSDSYPTTFLSKKKNTIRRWSAAALLASIATAFGSFSSARRVDDSFSIQLSSPDSFLNSGDFSQFQQVINAVEFIRSSGHEFGGQLARALLNFVPRSTWPNKGVDTGRLVTDPLWEGNPSASLLVEGYVDFGLPGVCFYACAAGVLASHLDDTLLRSRTDGSAGRTLATVLLAGSWLLVLRGSLLTWISLAQFAIAWFAAIVVLGTVLTHLTHTSVKTKRLQKAFTG